MQRTAHKAVACFARRNVTLLYPRHPVALFTTTTILEKKDTLPPRPKVAEEETTKRYLKGSGPGGQKINKTSSAVQLKHLPTGIVVKSQHTRSRTQNESIARRLLAEKVELLEKGSESRVEKKREKVSKKKRSAEKKSRRKYRRLAEEQGEDVDVDEDDLDVRDELEDDEKGSDDALQDDSSVIVVGAPDNEAVNNQQDDRDSEHAEKASQNSTQHIQHKQIELKSE